jgi:phosphatidylserine/phosphatidylglycerophosphate/cardiolipin synthase-like enzyme
MEASMKPGAKRRYTLAALILVLAAGLLAAAAFFGGLPPASLAAKLPPAATGAAPGWYQLFFTEPSYPDTQAKHHGGLDEKLAALIGSARSSVDMAIYLLDAPLVVDALSSAKARGLRVRLVTDIDTLRSPKEGIALRRLESEGIPVVAGNPNAIMHDKFVVVDAKAVWTGSWNFTIDDSYRYDNEGIVIESGELAANYTATFDKMFEKAEFGPGREPGGTRGRIVVGGAVVENLFSPEDRIAPRIVELIKGAKTKIDFLAFSFTDDEIGAAVRERAAAGLAVRGVFERTGSMTRFSEYGAMKKAGMRVFQDGNVFLMHIKAFIVDERYVAFGSYNFTKNAKTENDENLLLVDDPGMARAFEAEFEKVYAQAAAAAKD